MKGAEQLPYMETLKDSDSSIYELEGWEKIKADKIMNAELSPNLNKTDKQLF